MQFYPINKKVILCSLVCMTALNTMTVANAQELSKTPNLTVGETVNTTTPTPSAPKALPTIQFPSDYPEALNQFEIDARSYVVMDSDTSKILINQDGQTTYPIASMSKVISMYLIYQAIEQGKIKEDDTLVISQEIVDALSDNPGLSSAGLVANVEYPVKDLMNAIMLASGNDATTALMGKIYGSEQEAVKAMRSLMEEWGIDDAEFYTSSGVPVQFLPQDMRIEGAVDENENKLSAADVAFVAKKVVDTYPQILDITSQYEYNFMANTDYAKTLTNPSQLLEGKDYGRTGTAGLKSGFTDAAGHCYVAVSRENDRRIITVLMGAVESPYPGIYTLLDGLSQYPDLATKDGFTVNTRQSKAEKEAIAAKIAKEKADKAAKVEAKTNKRDSGLTKLMKQIFNF